MTVQFSMWDKFKEIDQMPSASRIKLGHFLSHLLLGKGLSLSIFKVSMIYYFLYSLGSKIRKLKILLDFDLLYYSDVSLEFSAWLGKAYNSQMSPSPS